MVAGEAEDLHAAVTRLSAALNGVDRRLLALRRLVITTIGGLVVITLVGAGLVYVLVQLGSTNRALSDVQQRTSNEVLCPLYRLFLEFEDRSVNSPLLSEQERDDRRKAYVVIREGYGELGCRL